MVTSDHSYFTNTAYVNQQSHVNRKVDVASSSAKGTDRQPHLHFSSPDYEEFGKSDNGVSNDESQMPEVGAGQETSRVVGMKSEANPWMKQSVNTSTYLPDGTISMTPEVMTVDGETTYGLVMDN